METELRSLEARQAEIEGLVAAETTVIRELGVRLDSMRGSPHLAAESARIDEQAAAQTERLTALRRERSENDAVIEGLARSIERSRRATRRTAVRISGTPPHLSRPRPCASTTPPRSGRRSRSVRS